MFIYTFLWVESFWHSLNEALISLHQILPKFQKENKLQKVQCVILTDGEGALPKYHREVQRRWEDDPYMGTAHIGPNAFIRDRKTGMTYSCDCEYHEFTDVLLRNLRDRFTDINFIGIRVLESRDAGGFIRRYCGYYGPDTYEKTMSIPGRKKKHLRLRSLVIILTSVFLPQLWLRNLNLRLPKMLPSLKSNLLL
jgi:hypothetical protein